MSTISARLQRQFEFLVEIDKLKTVERQNIITGESGRRENSAEHSWHVAMLAIILSEYSDKPIEIAKVVKMLLVHDLVEIDAGDVFVHRADEQRAQREREGQAAKRLFAILPEDQAEDLMDCWLEFEACATPEAKFAKALDRVQPVLMHGATDAVAWERHRTTKNQVIAQTKGVRENTPALWEKVRGVIDAAADKGRLC
ncbi:MAG: HD domain-containing protein [Nibricoccus sp.]